MNTNHCDSLDRREFSRRYTPEDFLEIKKKVCAGLPRRLRRFLLLLGILRQCSLPHLPSSHSITVHITHARPALNWRTPAVCIGRQNNQNLVRVPISCVKKRSRKNLEAHPPSIFFANVRAILNKFDEVNLRISSLKPDIAVILETWLDEDTPDVALSISGYHIARKDRNRHGGVTQRFCPLY